jgi:hypothetical protein
MLWRKLLKCDGEVCLGAWHYFIFHGQKIHSVEGKHLGWDINDENKLGYKLLRIEDFYQIRNNMIKILEMEKNLACSRVWENLMAESWMANRKVESGILGGIENSQLGKLWIWTLEVVSLDFIFSALCI